MHAQRDAQNFAIKIGLPGQELFVDADGQWRIVTEYRKAFLQGLE
jgi:hypothetical protein